MKKQKFCVKEVGSGKILIKDEANSLKEMIERNKSKLSYADLEGVDFSLFDLSNANFEYANLKNCIFNQVNLKGANFRFAHKVSFCDFRKTKFKNFHFLGTDLFKNKIKRYQIKKFIELLTFKVVK